MNDDKLKKLFEAARSEPQPAPSAIFAARVVSALSRAGENIAAPGLLEELILPARRFLVPAAALIVLLLGVELFMPAVEISQTTDIMELTDQWLFNFY